MHPGCSGFGEVGRFDVGVEGSEIWLRVVCAEGSVCFGELLVKRYGRKSGFGVGGSIRRTVREAVLY